MKNQKEHENYIGSCMEVAGIESCNLGFFPKPIVSEGDQIIEDQRFSKNSHSPLENSNLK